MENDIRVAVCGNLKTACDVLQKIDALRVDTYSDAVDLASRLRSGIPYDLVLQYAPHGEGLINVAYSYKDKDDRWQSIPIRLLNEPSCSSALSELKITINDIRKKRQNAKV